MNEEKMEVEHPVLHDHAQGESRLTRGLEDVSRLFLSQATPDTTHDTHDTTDQASVHLAEPVLADLLRPLPGVKRDRLVSVLEDHIAVLEEGLRSVDVGIPCDPFGPIDLLAVDSANRMVVVDLDESPGDELLLRGICHVDWVVRNIPLLRRMYRGRVIDFSTVPRVFLVAPNYSPRLHCAPRWITGTQISCFRYHTAALRNGAGILVEREIPA